MGLVPEWLAGKFCLEVTHEDSVKRSAGAIVMWKLDWGKRIPFHSGSFTWLTNWCQLLAEGLLSSPKSSWVSSCVMHLTSEWAMPQREKWSYNVFYSLASDVIQCHLHSILLIISYSWLSVKEDRKRMWIPADRITGGHLQNLATTVYCGT